MKEKTDTTEEVGNRYARDEDLRHIAEATKETADTIKNIDAKPQVGKPEPNKAVVEGALSVKPTGIKPGEAAEVVIKNMPPESPPNTPPKAPPPPREFR